MPPTKPSHDLAGEMLGAILCLPNRVPTKYAPMSSRAVIRTNATNISSPLTSTLRIDTAPAPPPPIHATPSRVHAASDMGILPRAGAEGQQERDQQGRTQHERDEPRLLHIRDPQHPDPAGEPKCQNGLVSRLDQGVEQLEKGEEHDGARQHEERDDARADSRSR